MYLVTHKYSERNLAVIRGIMPLGNRFGNCSRITLTSYIPVGRLRRPTSAIHGVVVANRFRTC